MLKAVLFAAFVVSASAQCYPNGALNVAVPLGGRATIQSPNYPSDYPNNANCQWLITGANNAKPGLELNSDDFDMEAGNCGYDYLTIIQVNADGSETQLGKFCGNNGPQRLVSATNTVKAIFRTDASITKRGFKVTIKEPVCAAGSNLCPGSETVCIRPDQYCNDEEDCPDGSDEGAGCSGECGNTEIPPKEDRSLAHFRNVLSARAKGQVHARIVGGVEATPHSLPWQVAMLSSSNSQICGGSIINDQWVMTAAHCCKAYAAVPRNYKVRVGAHVLGATNEANAKTYELTHLIVHPSYQRPSTYSNDFCLLKVNGRFDFGPHVGAICLADEDDCAAGTAAMVSGWGSSNPARQGEQIDNFDAFIKQIQDAEAGLVPKEEDPEHDSPRVANLRQVYVDVTTQAACSTAYPGSISPDMICASRAGKDSCQGDSGGPFVQKDPQGSWKLCGVVSWGRGCAQARYPGVYARITTAIAWIQQTILSN